MVEPVPFDDAAALIGAVRSGSAGAESIPEPPIIVVDLDAGHPDAGHRDVGYRGGGPAGGFAAEPLRPPATWPCVVVALSAGAAAPPAGADLYLTATPEPASPWAGGIEDVGRITTAIAAHPQASTTLVQVLRAYSGDADRDLLTESIAYASLQAGSEHRNWLATNHRAGGAADAGGDPPAVRTSRTGNRLEVVLDRPDRRNAYSAAMRDSLVAALELAATDPSIAEVHLRGNGSNFCAGGDLSEFGTVADPATAHQIRMSRSAGFLLHAVAQKVVAHVHGACVGAGVELPAFAARVLADPGATFRLPEVGMGLIPGAGGTASIPRRIGAPRTAWLALSGAELDACTALRWGLVDQLVDR